MNEFSASGANDRQRLTWELRLLHQVASTVSSSLGTTAALQSGLDQVADAFDVPWGVLQLRPIDGGPLEVRAVHGGPAEWSPDSAARTLSVPVMAGTDALGVLTLATDVDRRFSDDDERVLAAIGCQFGVAVANGQLYERVHRAKVQWEQTIDAIGDPMALFDHRGRTLRANAALATLRGWDIRDTPGRTCGDVGLCGGGCPGCLVGRTIRDGARLSEEITTADGRIFAVTTLPVPDAGGAVVQFAKEMTAERTRERQLRALSMEVAASNADLAATLERLRETQAQLVQAGKLSAVGQLVAGVAHELNNPLTSVIGYAQLVQRAVLSTPALARRGLRQDLSRIVSEAERAARIVRTLLTFARPQSAERRRHEIADLCNRVLDLCLYDARLKDIEVAVDYAPDLQPVYVDGDQIQQALLNLLLNAEQAMQGSGVKRLHIEALADPECSAALLRVRDTGHGIEADHLARVFDPFFTTRGVGEGTGLGLSIVYGIVREHGGQIWVDSVPGKGATFSIRLPVRTAEAGDSLALIAHADSVTRDFIGAVLRGWGYTVRLVATGREAMESLVEDDVSLALVDRSVVEGDPAGWRDRWALVRQRVALILLERGADVEAARMLRDEAAAVLAEPYDLRALRQALLTGGRTPALDPDRQAR